MVYHLISKEFHVEFLRSLLKSYYVEEYLFSLVYSHIIYTIHVWGSAGKSELDKIFILQKRAIRLISNKAKRSSIPGPLASTNPMFYKLEILKINDIFTLQIAKFIYKSLIGDTPENFHEWFKLNCDSHSYNTRSNYTDINNIVKSNNIFISSARTSFYGIKLIKVDGPKMWNSLLNSLRNINSLKKIVKCLKDYLIQKYI